MPTDSSTILPVLLGFPSASRGCTSLAKRSPRASCSAGRSFLPSGYSPPGCFWYSPAPSSVSGFRFDVSGVIRVFGPVLAGPALLASLTPRSTSLPSFLPNLKKMSLPSLNPLRRSVSVLPLAPSTSVFSVNIKTRSLPSTTSVSLSPSTSSFLIRPRRMSPGWPALAPSGASFIPISVCGFAPGSCRKTTRAPALNRLSLRRSWTSLFSASTSAFSP